MQRRTSLLCASIGLLAIGAACADTSHSPTEILEALAARSRAVTVTPSLDVHIRALIDSIYEDGKANEFTAQWIDVVKMVDGGNDPGSQTRPIVNARRMLVQIVGDMHKQPKFVSPTAGETTAHVLARLALYMSLYVFEGPATPEPALTLTVDAAVAVIDARSGGSVRTPSGRAAVSFPPDALVEQAIVVVTVMDGSLFPARCSGPLATTLCQYPEFYSFNVFPDLTLRQPASIALCELNNGIRQPLANRSRLRLAHARPADSGAYISGGSIVGEIEILPNASADSMVTCDSPDFARSGATMFFSDFAIVDPQSAPDLVPAAGFRLQQIEGFPGDTITVRAWGAKNNGTATALSSASEIDLASDSALFAGVVTLATTGGPTSLAPGATESFPSQQVVLPSGLAPGTYYLGARMDPANAVAESDETNNTTSIRITVLNPLPIYTITDLGALSAYGASSVAINDSNVVIGTSNMVAGNPLNRLHAFVWSSGVMTDIGTLGGTRASASGLNNLGEIVGISTTPDGTPHGYVRNASGEWRTLDLADGTLTEPYAINDAGDIVGSTRWTSTSEFQAVRWPARGAGVNLGRFDGVHNAVFRAVNQRGEAALVVDLGGDWRTWGFLWSPNAAPQLIADLPGSSGSPCNILAAMNDSGVVGGALFTNCTPEATFMQVLPFIWSARTGSVALVGAGVTFTSGTTYGINNHGVVVGRVNQAGRLRAYVWNRNRGMTLLPEPAGMTSSTARAINNRGVIVGYTRDASGKPHAIMWTPIP